MITCPHCRQPEDGCRCFLPSSPWPLPLTFTPLDTTSSPEGLLAAEFRRIRPVDDANTEAIVARAVARLNYPHHHAGLVAVVLREFGAEGASYLADLLQPSTAPSESRARDYAARLADALRHAADKERAGASGR